MRHLICFGDSITAGWNGENDTSRLTDRLVLGLNWSVRNAGVSGETTDQGIKRINRDVLGFPYDKVTVLFGANDSSFHKGIPVTRFARNLESIARAISPQKTIFITPSPVIDTRQTGKRTNERVSLYAETVRECARLLDIPLIDLYQEMAGTGNYESMLLEDGLHFSDKGYDFLADLMTGKLKNMYQQKIGPFPE
jgi:Lysophospholipase L1 and related esterases